MKLDPIAIRSWPKLAWVAVVVPGRHRLRVYHGPYVEVHGDWLAEAIWLGEFEAGDFDRTELVFGTGIRIRPGRVIFVSAGTMMDRLWQRRQGERWFIGNSLPAVLACSETSLDDSYRGYTDDMRTQMKGLNLYQSTIPAAQGELSLTYFRNIVYSREVMTKIDKPDTVPEFHAFEDYHQFLVNSARGLRKNIESPRRRFRVHTLSSVSSGYDGCASAAIAREAGCGDAVTIENASSLLPRSDSGGDVARHLGLTCQTYSQAPGHYRHEETVWSVAGEPAGLNLTIFDYPKPLCVFFSGYRGDSVWNREQQDRSQPFRARSIAGLGMAEFRLHEGVFHCLVPFCGSLRAQQIQDITFSPEMAAWTLGNDYDRPIPRRILEDASVPRGLFGLRKNATFAPRSFLWPFTPECMGSFRTFLQDRGLYAPSRGGVWLRRKISHADQLLTVNTNHALGTRFRGLRRYLTLRGQQMLFQWGNHELKCRYQAGLADQGRDVASPSPQPPDTGTDAMNYPGHAIPLDGFGKERP